MTATVATWITYAADLGTTVANDADSAAALARAVRMVRLRYVPNLLPGYSVDFTPEGADYPLVDEAAYIAAGYELATPGFFSKTYTAAEQKVLTKVDAIQWTVIGDASGTYAYMPSSSLIDAMFEPYILDRDKPGFMFRAAGP